MNAEDIILIIISGLGVIHGLFIGLFLLTYKSGNQLSNKLLSILLFVLSFRVGKSVFLEFTNDIDVKIIFIGLSAIMAIGPLFYIFIKSCIDRSFKFNSVHLIQFVPAIAGLAFGFYINSWTDFPEPVLVTVFLSYYAHFLVYLIIGFIKISKAKQQQTNKEVIAFLTLIWGGLLAIWFVYVLNLFDDLVPYVIGPILYSLIAYAISFIVFKNGYVDKIGQTKYKTNPVSDEKSDQLFDQLNNCLLKDKRFKDPNITLKILSKELKVSPQVLSLVVNQKSGGNFNNFINGYRIDEATVLLKSKSHENQTIAAIAFESGFNSISSFNTAFKKKTSKTPLAYRKSLLK